MSFLTIDQRDEETWNDQQKGKDKDIGSNSVIWWLNDTDDYSWQIEILKSWHWGYWPTFREWTGQYLQFLRCFFLKSIKTLKQPGVSWMKNVHHCTQVEFFPILHHLKLSPIDIIFKAYKTGFTGPFCRILCWQQHAHIWVSQKNIAQQNLKIQKTLFITVTVYTRMWTAGIRILGIIWIGINLDHRRWCKVPSPQQTHQGIQHKQLTYSQPPRPK